MSNKFTSQLNDLRVIMEKELFEKVNKKRGKTIQLGVYFNSIWDAGFDEVEECEILELKIDSKSKELLAKIAFYESNSQQYTSIKFIEIKSLAKLIDSL